MTFSRPCPSFSGFRLAWRRAAGLMVLGMLSSSIAQASPIGRPITAERQWVIGAVGGVERIKMRNTGVTTTGDLRSTTILGEAAYGFTADAEFYLRFGRSTDEYEQGTVQDLGSTAAWGLGVRSVVYESWRDWRIIGDLQYLSRSDHSFGVADVDLWEYQLASALEVRLDDFYPYGGVFYNRLEAASNNQGVYRDQKSDQGIGIYGGIGWEPRPEWVLHAETRLLHGPGFSGGVAYRF